MAKSLENGAVKKRSTKWVLNHLRKQDLKKLLYHIEQVNLLAQNSGVWHCQRAGFFKQSDEMEQTLRDAIAANVYDTKIEKETKKRWAKYK